MTAGDGACQPVSRAQAALREARNVWNAADLSSIEKTKNLLEASCHHLREFHTAVEQGRLIPTPQMRIAVMDLKNRIAHLTRMVDASSAFMQALAVYAGIRSSTYNASGEIEYSKFAATGEL